jgi:hypothetical protein
MPVDYSKGKIYKIVNAVDDEIYVGSTCELLCKRIAKHRSVCKKGKISYKLYKHMRLIGIEHFHIYLVENCPCENREQLRRREGYWIKKIGTLNELIAGRTRAEYYQDNYEKLTEYNRKYQKKRNSKEKAECEICGSIVRKDTIPRHKRSKKCQSFLKIEFKDKKGS